jgi:nucleoside 2-deoxyribosyltransferase
MNGSSDGRKMSGQMNKKFFIIHSKGLTDKARELADGLRAQGHEVYVPGIQTKQDTDELTICTANREAMSAADEVRVIWDGTSHGVIFDLGMAFALGKPIKLEYVIPKSMKGLMERLSDV